ncbi:MAG: hypothetical protein AA908_09900 [Chlorobi bacterium NICIL-2]|nr:MAG: hypothetical protein AA908_09900 [Chlorobi bacterium NICIL-2]
MVQSRWGNHWNASYSKLNGYQQRRITLNEGTHTFTIEVTTKSGELNLSITGQDGTEYYKGSKLPTSTFQVHADIPAKDKITLRVDAKNHSGGLRLSGSSPGLVESMKPVRSGDRTSFCLKPFARSTKPQKPIVVNLFIKNKKST